MILASRSPRRKELLEQAGFTFSVYAKDVDETPLPHERGDDLAKRLALKKALATKENLHTDDLILAADTVVWLENATFGKPKDKADARRMLEIFSAKTHFVTTGVAILYKEKEISFTDTAEVTFKPLLKTEIEAYIQTDEPYDKAGGYAVQGLARPFITEVKGDENTVIGLPVSKVVERLEALGFKLPTSGDGARPV